MVTTGNNGRARTVSSESKKRVESSDAWVVVDQDAYGLLGLQQGQLDRDEAADMFVQEAFEAQVDLAAGDDAATSQLQQAFNSVGSQVARNNYNVALAMRPGDSSQTKSSMKNGIAAVLHGKNAPYGRLLATLLKLLGTVELQLPQIIVCGTESHGKSSTLERIAMHEIFPRDRRFCTRMPVRLKLRFSMHEHRAVFVRLVKTETGEVVSSLPKEELEAAWNSGSAWDRQRTQGCRRGHTLTDTKDAGNGARSGSCSGIRPQ